MPRIHLILADDVLDALDAQRGLASRSAWVGHLISPSEPEPGNPIQAADPGHRHRRFVVIGKAAVKGQMVDRWACSCGKVLT